MSIYNLGSINADTFYGVPHLPIAGETLAATSLAQGLGGKGANQSVAAALAGSIVKHIGAVGPDGGWAVDALTKFGVDCGHVVVTDVPTGHAIINVDPAGENAIVLFAGANQSQSLNQLKMALEGASPNDYLLFQNETSLQVEAAQIAHEKGLTVICSAAPFSASVVKAVMPFIDILVMNEVEAGQLTSELGMPLSQLSIPKLLITKGAQGADWIEQGRIHHVPAFSVTPIDTTGAGDCFIGYVAASLDQGMRPVDAMRLAAGASALQVQKPGAANAIPTRAEVDTFLA